MHIVYIQVWFLKYYFLLISSIEIHMYFLFPSLRFTRSVYPHKLYVTNYIQLESNVLIF